MYSKSWYYNIATRTLNDVKHLSFQFLKGHPFVVDGAYLSVLRTEEKLNTIKLYQYKEHYFEDGYIALNKLLNCEFKVNTNNIYIYSRNIEDFSINFCNSDINENKFYPTYIPFYIKWFTGKQLNFELHGNYINFSTDKIENQMYNFPAGSTLIITSAIEHNGVRKVTEEQFPKNLDISPFGSNPYYRFLKNIFLNPENNHFYIKIQNQVKQFTTNINELSDFSNEGIKTWQETQIRNFIKIYLEDFKYINSKSEAEFFSFVKNNLFDKEQNFLEAIITFQEQNFLRYKEYLLFNLISKNNIEKTNAILNSDINVNCILKDGITPLHLATILERGDIVRLLIEHNTSTEAATSNNITPLMIAAEQNYVPCAKLLLNSSANPNAKENNGLTPLFFGIQKHSIELVTLLLEYKADLNMVDNYGNIPLTLAIQTKNVPLVKLLLSYAPNLHSEEYINFKQSYEYTKDVFDEIKVFENNPIKYILRNNQYTNKTIKALDNLKSYTDSEINVFIDQVQNCVYSLNNDESYSNLLELCYGSYKYDLLL